MNKKTQTDVHQLNGCTTCLPWGNTVSLTTRSHWGRKKLID